MHISRYTFVFIWMGHNKKSELLRSYCTLKPTNIDKLKAMAMLTASRKSPAGRSDESLNNARTAPGDHLRNERYKMTMTFWITNCRRPVPGSVCTAAPATPGSPGCCCSGSRFSPCYLHCPTGSIWKQEARRSLCSPPSYTDLMQLRLGCLFSGRFTPRG